MNRTSRLTRFMAATAVVGALTALGTGAEQAYASDDYSTNPPLSATSTPDEADAINYINARMGDTSYDGYCQRLVREAYASTGVDITATAGDNSSAVSFWNTTNLEKHPASTDIPAGALVFWGATSTNPAGHVAIALGGDSAASTSERDNDGVHVFSLSARNAAGYEMLGWVMPA
ncbi:NlpC/P60 family protein [Nocardioides sp. C4-1]|uniref:NlpC/P60 family protein n=1 Tax=Nocardioides sp. C4-1 TaxID=3151851 RepID=UPI0032648F1E